MGGAVIPLDRAVYCANPDAVAECIKLCPAAEVVSIGVRVGTYLQVLSYFLLVLVAPDEGGAESMWLGLSVSFSFLAACYVQLYLGTITLHHTVVVALLSHLPYISTLAGMNSLTSYEVLGPAGVLFLQTGMLVKSALTAILWGFCLRAFFVGQLPHWTGLQFRQANCFRSTALVVWLVPIRPPPSAEATAPSPALDVALIVTYSLYWLLVLAIGSYWTLIAPRILVERGGHLRDPKKRKVKGFPLGAGGEPEELLHRLEGEDRAFAGAERSDEDGSDADDGEEDRKGSRGARSSEGHPGGYQRDPDYGAMDLMTLRSLPMSGPVGFASWPLVTLLLVFTIVTIEVQMVANDVYAGEMELDFPGALTLFLALPTVWAVLKALKRIQEGRRPTPNERQDQTFWELAREKEERKLARRRWRESRGARQRMQDETSRERRQERRRRPRVSSESSA
ncbi:hypothetical protein JCM8202v2_000945 [Rhodotorula sphaerocarpa]